MKRISSFASGLREFGDQLEQMGIPTVRQFVERYCRLTGKPLISDQVFAFYVAFVCFRFAAIVQGVYKRFLQGKKLKVERVAVKESTVELRLSFGRSL